MSLSPIFRDMSDLAQEILTTQGTTPEMEQAYVLVNTVMGELAERYNLFAMLEPAPLFGIPALMAQRMPIVSPLAGTRAELVIKFLLPVIFWMIILTLVGLGFNTVYLRMIGHSVIEETESSLPGPGEATMTWWRMIQLGVIIIIALFSASMAISFVVMFVGLFSVGIAGFILTLASSFILLIGMHLIFAVPGILQLRRTPFKAIQESVLLTRGDFLGSTALVLLLIVISRGLNFVWSLPDPASWATIVGVAGHAFVSSALISTLFVFYQERLVYLKMLQKLYATKDARVRPIDT